MHPLKSIPAASQAVSNWSKQTKDKAWKHSVTGTRLFVEVQDGHIMECLFLLILKLEIMPHWLTTCTQEEIFVQSNLSSIFLCDFRLYNLNLQHPYYLN